LAIPENTPYNKWVAEVLKTAQTAMKTALYLTFILITATLAWGQNPLTKDSRVGIPPFEFDFAAFADSASDKNRLEVYYKLRNTGFSFVKKGSAYKAAYDLETTIIGSDGRTVASQHSSEEFSVPDYEQTQSAESYRINSNQFLLAPGTYEIKIQVTDKNSEEVSPAHRKVNVPNFKAAPIAMSNVELIGAFADTAELERFKKGGRTVIPSVSHFYGDPDSLLIFYFELYANPPDAKNPLLSYEITQRYHGTWSKETTSLNLEKPRTAFFADLSLSRLPPGEYKLKIAVKEEKKDLAKQEVEFKMGWNWEAALTHNFKELIEILRYFSREKDLKTLEKAAPEKRLEAWNDFWAQRDPTPASRQNEAREEFDRRIRFADSYFAHMGLPGWRSDMGKIYIRYGEPDQVDEDPTGQRNTNPNRVNDPYSTNVTEIRRTGHASQTWYYFSYRRAFSFEDVTGNGSWVLKPPLDGRRF